MKSSENPIPVIQTQEGEHNILGRYQIVIEGKKGVRIQNALIIKNPEGAEHPFRAIDEKSEEEIPLTITKIIDVYRTVLQTEPPEKYLPGPNKYWLIRNRKRKEQQRKSIPIETPTQH